MFKNHPVVWHKYLDISRYDFNHTFQLFEAINKYIYHVIYMHIHSHQLCQTLSNCNKKLIGHAVLPTI